MGHVPRFRLKEWCYQSVATPEVFVAFAVAQLGYVAQAFAYVVDRRTGARASAEHLSPLGRALRVAPCATSGSSHWQSRGVSIVCGFDAGFTAQLALSLSGARAELAWSMQPEDALALVFPLASDRLAYTHKAAGMRVSGRLRWGEANFDLRGGLGTLDYTRSHADRHTRWNWASFTGHTASGRRLGINLSAHVYDDNTGNSTENARWLDGRVQVLGGVRFEVPTPTTGTWRIVSRDGSGEVDLTVRPAGERRSALDLKLVRSAFAQPYGEASGMLCGERVEGLYGVVEDHDALW